MFDISNIKFGLFGLTLFTFLTLSNVWAQSEAEIQPYRQYMHFRQLLQTQDMTNARAFVDNQISFTNVFLIRKMQLDLAEAYYNRAQIEDAVFWAKKVLSYGPDQALTPRAQKIMVLAQLDGRHTAESLTEYGRLLERYPQADWDQALFGGIQKILQTRFNISDCFNTSSAYYHYLRALIPLKREDILIAESRRFLLKFSTAPELGQVYYGLGLGLYRKALYRDAMSAFEQAALTEKDPRLQNIDYFYAAQSALHSGHPSAILWFERVISLSKGSPIEATAFYWLCRYYAQIKDKKAYEATESRFHHKWGSSPEWAQLTWEKQWRSLRLQAQQGVPLARLQDHFRTALDHPLLAERITSFYRAEGKTLSQGILQYPLQFQTLTHLKVAVSNESPLPEFIQSLDRKLSKLHALGLGDIADEEVRSLEGQQSDTPKGTQLRYWYGTLVAKFSRWMEDGHSFLPAIDLDLQQASQWPIPKFLLKLLYPRPYWDIITQYSHTYHVDPYLVLAIMREESTFDPRATSRVHARGLMQLMPTTARDISFRLGKRWKGPDTLEAPLTNIQLGVFYVSWLSKQLKGPIYYTIAAYNAGPEVASQWIKGRSSEDLEDFISKIPYSETQTYVQKVMASYMIYKLLYGPGN